MVPAYARRMDIPNLSPEQYQELLLNIMIQMVVRTPDGASRILAAILELEELLGPEKVKLHLVHGGKY